MKELRSARSIFHLSKTRYNKPMLIDTHCHIHEPIFELDADQALDRAKKVGVEKVICVGTSQESSRLAVEFATTRPDVYASVGVHPHDTKDGWAEIVELIDGSISESPSVRVALQGAVGSPVALGLGTISPSQALSEDEFRHTPADSSKLVAIGEIGLDYFYSNSPRDVQIQALEQQLQWAVDYNLPVIFHVRDGASTDHTQSVWNDFWPIFDNFPGLRGELHSFTDTIQNMQSGLERGLYIGVNGISTFTKDPVQQAMFAAIPLEKMVLETDSPFLTPVPFRGKINEPAFVREVAAYHADARSVSLDTVASQTTTNATALFAI